MSVNIFADIQNRQEVTQTIISSSENIVTHTVVKGETVYSIAATYKTNVREIYKLNPDAENGIKAGDKLKIQKTNEAPAEYSNHLIEPKETLYSVSKMYKITEEDIKRANPGLNESTFSIGKTIRIPRFDFMPEIIVSDVSLATVVTNSYTDYKVQKGETLYSIGKAYNVSVENLLNSNTSLRDGGLKEGMTIRIPQGQIQTQPIDYTNINNQANISSPHASQGEMVKVGVLLPFKDDKGSIQKEKLVEYYEGFLLAVKNMKEKGLNAEVYGFDIGTEKNTKKLESLLETYEMNNLHLVIGGVSKQQIDILSEFSRNTGIKYAIPFGASKNIESIPTLFQMTTSHSSRYPEVIDAFKRQYSNANIVFVSEAGSNNDKSDFVNELKKGLSGSNIQFKTTASSESLADDIQYTLDATRQTVLIPTSSSELTLRRLFIALNTINPTNVSLFGYPEWQAYPQHRINLHKYDSRIYGIFFADDQQKEAQEFIYEYKRWYNKDLISSLPKYGYMGYDAGIYFLTALNRFGSEFETYLDELRVPLIQSVFHFKKLGTEKGGYINEGLYFIHYKVNSEIEKTDVSNKW
jgi:LysM repeat protein